MTTPAWALSLAYWLHMLATVVWIGGLAALSILVLPAARAALDLQAYSNLLDNLQKRLDPLGWFCLALLGGTGLFQMSSNPNYHGFLAIDNRWAVAILVKHLVFIAMIGLSIYMTWFLMPGLRRAALRQSRGQDSPETGGLRRQEILLMRFNLILGVLVLALTAVARAA
jgi:uncharacterized membrane protein